MIHLHVHTDYSLLDGAARIDKLLIRAKEYDMSAMAITDHGTMGGVIDFLTQAKKFGIKPLLGVECYLVEDHTKKEKQGVSHLTLISRDLQGYQNLCQLVSRSVSEGYYQRPRISLKLLEGYSEGLFILSGCELGLISKYLKTGDIDKAVNLYNYLNSLAPTYVEIQWHGMESQRKIINNLKPFYRASKAPLVVTNDLHYVDKSDAYYQEALLAVQTRTNLYDPERFKFDSQELYLKTEEELDKDFREVWPKDFPTRILTDAFAYSKSIADACTTDTELVLNTYNFPEPINCQDPDKELLDKIKECDFLDFSDPCIKERLNLEYKTIKECGFSGYFLIVKEIYDFAARNDICLGPGRGSVVGCLVAFSLGITAVNPLDYGLYFERFLNPDRIQPPDIDIDIPQSKREIVYNHVRDLFGEDKVAHIRAYGAIGAKQALKDSARILLKDFIEVNTVTSGLPDHLDSVKIPLLDHFENCPEVRQYAKDNPDVWDIALNLEGLRRNKSIHASGVVIGDEPLSLSVSLEEREIQCISGDMRTAEFLGLLKFDFLGLRNLDIFSDTLKLTKIIKDTIPFDDIEVYQYLEEGFTEGLFQIETKIMTKALRKIKPLDLEGLGISIALPRPGTADFIDEYVRRGLEEWEPESYSSPEIDKILLSTRGIPVYQEQLMAIAREVGGLTLAQADILRKAIGKKDKPTLKRIEPDFYRPNKYKLEVKKYWWSRLEKAGTYAFNKAHAIGYAVLAYREAWLKYHYPLEYYSCLLNYAEDSDPAKQVAKRTTYSFKAPVEILPIDINKSVWDNRVESGQIRLGFKLVKHVGKDFIVSLIKDREIADFLNIADFSDRVNPNKRALQALIGVGAFSGLHPLLPRSELTEWVPSLLKEVRARKKRKRDKELHLAWPDEDFNQDEVSNIPLEFEGLGFSHTLAGYRIGSVDYMMRNGITHSSIRGTILSITERTTKTGNKMGFLDWADKSGVNRVLVFSEEWKKYKKSLKPYRLTDLTLRLQFREGYDPGLILERIKVW